ncbi:MAG TPA: hypothetical protein VI300_20500 [Solirubrobacter sp.]
METTPTTFGPPDADLDDLADAPDPAFDELDKDDDIETPDEGEPDATS